jgi:hypothetical protein
MKKTNLIILTTILGTLFLFTGVSFGQYGYGDDRALYDNDEYSDYEYRLDNADYQLDRCQGPVYYFYHQRAGVYFVLVNDMTFVVPEYTFRSYLPRRNFLGVPQSRFITLSCCGLDYYNSSLRFNFYYGFYNRHRWDQKYHYQMRRDFRKYYTGSRHKYYTGSRHNQGKYYTGSRYNQGYQKNRRQVVVQRERTRYTPQHRYPVNDRQQIKSHKRYKQQGDSRRGESKRKYR